MSSRRSFIGRGVSSAASGTASLLRAQIRVVRFVEQQTLALLQVQRASVNTAADLMVGTQQLFADRLTRLVEER